MTATQNPGGALPPSAEPEPVGHASPAVRPETARTVEPPLVRVEDLHVGFRTAGSQRVTPVVRGIDFTVHAGECLAVVGQSGSGKSVTARTLMGLAGDRAVVKARALRLGELDLQALSRREWHQVRGARIGLILQDALVSLDPLRPVGREVDDVLRLHTRQRPGERRLRVHAALAEAGIDDPRLRAAQRAGELSGGLRQRALIAAAIALEPPLIIADEPTTALDQAVQRHVLDTLGRLRGRGTAVLLISHDLSVVARVADRVAVMQHGTIVEEGETRKVLGSPAHPYTKRLLRAVPDGRPRGSRLSTLKVRRTAMPYEDAPTGTRANSSNGPGGMARVHGEATDHVAAPCARETPALELKGITVSYRTPFGMRTVVDGVTLSLSAGHTLGLVGPSGSGKTTTARIALGLTIPQRGTVTLWGEPWVPLREAERRSRRRMIGAVYQDALSSFDPRRTVGTLLADALTGGRSISLRHHADRIADLLAMVGLPADLMRRRPHSLSGGQRQLVAIARALAPGPRVLVCDEPVSSLDVLVQAQVLDVFDDLQERFGLAYLFISHDLGVIRHVSDEVAVMEHGRIIAQGPAEETPR